MADNKKKKGEPEKRLILGRVSSHLKMGIVGLPNVGKSSLFNLLTKCDAKAENYPFCTIDPNNDTYLGQISPDMSVFALFC